MGYSISFESIIMHNSLAPIKALPSLLMYMYTYYDARAPTYQCVTTFNEAGNFEWSGADTACRSRSHELLSMHMHTVHPHSSIDLYAANIITIKEHQLYRLTPCLWLFPAHTEALQTLNIYHPTTTYILYYGVLLTTYAQFPYSRYPPCRRGMSGHALFSSLI
jgi:hypothetical protein